MHEGHSLPREGSGIFDKPGVPKPIVVQTQVELKLMEAVPAMYGAADSSQLREELREDSQARPPPTREGATGSAPELIPAQSPASCRLDARRVFGTGDMRVPTRRHFEEL